MSDFDIYTPEGLRVDRTEDWESVQWLEQYQQPGEVKMVASASAKNLQYLVPGNRIHNTERGTVALIDEVLLRDDAKARLEVWASMTGQRLESRVVYGTTPITNAEAGMYLVYTNNRRELELEVAPAKGYPEEIDLEISWGTALEAVNSIAKASGLGYRVNFDPLNAQETLEVYRGVDRSNDSSDEYVGYWGDDIENFVNVQFREKTMDYKNVAVVVGPQEEGYPQGIVTVSPLVVAGNARREMYVNASSIRRKYREPHDTGQKDEFGNPVITYTDKEYTPDEHEAMLHAKGIEELAKKIKEIKLDGDAVQEVIRFGKDYGLGDRMPIKLEKIGLRATAMVAAVKLIYQGKTGVSANVVLDDFIMEGF